MLLVLKQSAAVCTPSVTMLLSLPTLLPHLLRSLSVVPVRRLVVIKHP